MKKFLYLLISTLTLIPGLSSVSASGVQTPSGELLLASDGSLYGTSTDGGDFGTGSLFQVTPESEITVHVHFTDGIAPALGAFPRAGLVADSAGNLWGTSEQGGQFGYGTVFKFNPTTKVLTTEHEFANTDGAYPVCTLLNDGTDRFIGTTREGGTGGLGTIFRIDSSNSTLTVIAEFTGLSGAVKGSNPKGGLRMDGMGRFWGTTSTGGVNNLGSIYRTDLVTVTTVVEFTGTNGAAEGASALTSLVSDGAGNLWGTTLLGGNGDFGTVFKINTTTDVFTTVHEFDDLSGSSPSGRLVLDGAGGFFGTASQGGQNDAGTIFRINIASGLLETVTDFTGTTGDNPGSFPTAGLTADGLGNFWGVATAGGVDNNGTIFTIGSVSEDFLLIAEPYDTPKPPTVSVAAPPSSGTSGSAINLTGTADPEFNLKSVVVSLNGGPFLPATIIEGADPSDPLTWSISILPIDGLNTVLIKSVDGGGDASQVRTLKFTYGPIRPDAGIYNGLVSPTGSSTTPLRHSGFFTLKVLPTGKFTGKVLLNGMKPVTLKGSIDNSGTALFGKLLTPTLTVLRGTLPTQVFSLGFTTGPTLAAVANGSISESSVTIATMTANEALYVAKKNPVAPNLNVPASLLNPLTDKGSYTGVFSPSSELPASNFPQGSGYSFIKVAKTGKVRFVGKLADGSPFAAAALLTEGNIFPFYSKLYAGKGALTGLITFQDTPGQSDADGSGLNWYKPASTKHLSYPLGWADGIQTDFIASKFVSQKLNPSLTPLGNLPATSNATITLNHTELGAAIDTELSITAKGVTTALDTDISTLKLKFSAKGGATGSYIDSSSTKLTLFSGVVLQKTQSAAGFFLVLPPVATPTLPRQSGSMEITTP